MIRVALGLTIWLACGLLTPAVGDSDPVTPDQNQFLVQVKDGALGTVRNVDHGKTSLPSCASSEGEACREVVICLEEPTTPLGGRWVLFTRDTTEVFGWCVPGSEKPAEERTVTPGLVSAAFRRVPLPAAHLVVQPPGGKTLVNFDTIFSTDSRPFQRVVRLLGHEVRLRIWASSFSWHFGDGSEPLLTTEAGRTYQRGLPMDSYITHQYKHADVTVRPRVNTTYSAEYSVDGGPFQPVIGTVTIDGEPTTLRVVEARPVLTGTR